MQIKLKLMGVLKEKSPPSGVLELHEGATIADTLARLGIDPGRVQVYTLNGKLERDPTRQLQDGDELSVLPPVGGG